MNGHHEGAVAGGRDIAFRPPVFAPAPGNAGLADAWRLGRLLEAEPAGRGALAQVCMHPGALPRLAALGAIDRFVIEAGRRIATAGRRAGYCPVIARAGPTAWATWLPDRAAAAALCERWLSSLSLKRLELSFVSVRCRPRAAWVPWPTDGAGRVAALDALRTLIDRPLAAAGRARSGRSSRTPAMRGTDGVGLEPSSRGDRVEPLVALPAGRIVGWRVALAESEGWPVRRGPARGDAAASEEPTSGVPTVLQTTWPVASSGDALTDLPIPAALLEDARPLAGSRAWARGPACLLVPESLAWDSMPRLQGVAARLSSRGLSLGLDDYRGWIPLASLARAGVHRVRLHPDLLPGLGEEAWCERRLAELLRGAAGARIRVLVTGVRTGRALAAASAAGAREVSGALFEAAGARRVSGERSPPRAR